MPRFFVKTNQIQGNCIEIIGKDVNHIKNALRTKIGDKIEICDEETEKSYISQIEKIEENKILTKIIQELEKNESKIKIDIYQGLPKSEKMELIIQKSVELGANSIIPVSMKRCVVKLSGKDEIKKIERWQKISESASKQCGRTYIPQIKEIIKINQIASNEYDSTIVCYENEEQNTLKQEIVKIKEQNKKDIKIAVVIGPEGGIDENDIEELKKKNAKIVTLGKRILRTETVALNTLSILMYELEG